MGKPLPAAVEQRQSRLTQDPRERSARANQSRALPGWDELPPLPGFTWTCWLQDPTMCSVLLLKRQKVDGCIVGFRDSSSSAPPGRQVLAELPQSVHACCGYALNPPWFFSGSLHARRTLYFCAPDRAPGLGDGRRDRQGSHCPQNNIDLSASGPPTRTPITSPTSSHSSRPETRGPGCQTSDRHRQRLRQRWRAGLGQRAHTPPTPSLEHPAPSVNSAPPPGFCPRRV